jgi:hypothetical protein
MALAVGCENKPAYFECQLVKSQLAWAWSIGLEQSDVLTILCHVKKHLTSFIQFLLPVTFARC